MKKKHAEELTQTLKQLMMGCSQQIFWQMKMGVPQALGYKTAQEWMRRRLGICQITKLLDETNGEHD